MGSNAFQFAKEDLCCPVCKNPLSSPGSPPKQKITKQKVGRGKGCAPHLQSNHQASKNARIAVSKFKDHEDIVLARCGHLFHKFCLRHYCYLFREGRPNPTCRVTCPVCHEHISMMSAHFIDYKGHQGKITDAEKDFKKTELMNNELMGQKETVKKKLQKVARSIEDGYGNLQIYRTHRKKLKHDVKQAKSVTREIDDLYGEIEQADKMLAYMQTQHLKIVRKFINQAKRKSPSEFKHLPRRLAPFLHLIEEDDRLVRNLGEILVPIQVNHLKSDRRSLLVDIITIVNDKIAAEKRKAAAIRKSLRTIAAREQSPILKTPPNTILPVVVKVRKSSVSILSSKSLTQESIKKIMETVDDPIQVMKKAYKASVKHKVKLANKISNNVVDNVSASDIKIIYMPKRKMLEQVSEPCRTVDESESLVAAVPPRKCKSTDAVLMKCRKKRQKGVSSRSKSKMKLVNKRSNSITAIHLSKDVGQNKITGRNPEIKEKLTTKRDPVHRPPESEPVMHETPDSVIKDVNNSKHEEDQDIPIEVEYDFNQNVMYESKPPTGDLPNEDGDKAGSLAQPVFSVLKLIYDNLEEERKPACHFSKARLELESILDTNRSELPDRNFTSQMPTIGTLDFGNVLPPRPQFFKVDRKGIVRPESPYTPVTFRQPTFLNLSLSYEQHTCPLTGCEQPDEENQLGALSPEERLLIASEQESTTPRRSFLSGHEKRQVYHGIPACMGVSNGQYNLPDTPDHWKVPYYLRKWQQQLPSRKVVKTTPRKVACNVIRTARIPHANKRDAKHEYFSRTMSKPQNVSMCLLELGTHSDAVHLPNLPLPPLSMYPVKRPSTAECNHLETLYKGRITEPDSVLRLYSNSPK